MAEMDALMKQMVALLGDLHGYADKLETEATEVAGRAAGQKKAAAEYDALLKKIGEAQAKLDILKTEIAHADKAKAALKDLASKM